MIGEHRGRPYLSLVVPARNESALIARTLGRLDAVLAGAGIDYEIVVSDSASTDDTAAIVSKLANPRVKLVRNTEAGKGRAIVTGMLAASGDCIGFIDADLEIDAGFILPMLEAVADGADFAIGFKATGDPARSLHRRVATICYNALVRQLLGTPFQDHQAGLKLFRASCIRPLLPHVQSTGWFWDSEVLFALHRARARCAEVRVQTTQQRTTNVSFLRVSCELLVSALKLRLARRYPRHPGVPVPVIRSSG